MNWRVEGTSNYSPRILFIVPHRNHEVELLIFHIKILLYSFSSLLVYLFILSFSFDKKLCFMDLTGMGFILCFILLTKNCGVWI